MHHNQILFGLSTLVITGGFWIVGYWFKKNRPKRINSFYGYRSKNAMKNQKLWDFAQTKAASGLFLSGTLQLTTLGLLPFVPKDVRHTPYCIAGIVVLLIGNLVILSFRTERAIQKEM